MELLYIPLLPALLLSATFGIMGTSQKMKNKCGHL